MTDPTPDPHAEVRAATAEMRDATKALAADLGPKLTVRERAVFAVATATMQEELDADVPWEGCNLEDEDA